MSHEKIDLLARIGELEKLETEKELASTMEKDLRARISQLENELFDKNKVRFSNCTQDAVLT